MGELPISNLSWRLAVILSVLAAGGIWGVAELLKHFTNSQVPYLDAVTTVLSLIAQWMICKKIIQTWFYGLSSMQFMSAFTFTKASQRIVFYWSFI